MIMFTSLPGWGGIICCEDHCCWIGVCSKCKHKIVCFLSGLIDCWTHTMQYNKDGGPRMVWFRYWNDWIVLELLNYFKWDRTDACAFLYKNMYFSLLLLNDLLSVENVFILCLCIIDLNRHEILCIFGYNRHWVLLPKIIENSLLKE